MDKYIVKLASPAAKIYENISRRAAGDDGGIDYELLHIVDKVIDDVISSNPYQRWHAPLGLYWISYGSVLFFYDVLPQSRVVLILWICAVPARRDNVKKADMICTQLLLSGKVQVLPPMVSRTGTN